MNDMVILSVCLKTVWLTIGRGLKIIWLIPSGAA
jgi:hypothetical protein